MASKERPRWRRVVGEVLWDRDRYGVVFVLLLLSYVILSLSNSYRWSTLVRMVPVGATLLFALHTSGARRVAIRLAQGAVGLSLLIGVVQGLTGNTRLASLCFLLVGMLLLVTPIAMMRRVFQHGRVDLETVFAAISLYLILGLIFSQFYVFIAHVTSAPFLTGTAHGDMADPPLGDFVYLSFESLTTVGFGDITAATEAGRSLVVIEALFGQIFLVTLVARLVSMYGMAIPPQRLRRHVEQDGRGASGSPHTDVSPPTAGSAPQPVPTVAAPTVAAPTVAAAPSRRRTDGGPPWFDHYPEGPDGPFDAGS